MDKTMKGTRAPILQSDIFGDWNEVTLDVRKRAKESTLVRFPTAGLVPSTGSVSTFFSILSRHP